MRSFKHRRRGCVTGIVFEFLYLDTFLFCQTSK